MESVLLKETHKITQSVDELSVLGVITFVTWLLISVAWSKRGGFGQLLWFCDLATLGTAIGLLFKNRLLLTAQITGIFAYHLAWHLDFLSYITLDLMPFSATAYMFSGDMVPYEKSLSFFQHTFIIPVILWALFRLGSSRYGWLFQTIQTFSIFVATYCFTKPSENINWIFGAGFAGLSPARMNPVYYYSLMVIIPPLMIYIPINRLVLCLNSQEHFKKIRHMGIGCRATIAIAYTTIIVVVSAFVGIACDVKVVIPNSLLKLPPVGQTPLEKIPIKADAPQVHTAMYGKADQEKEIPLRVFEGRLPRWMNADGSMGAFQMSKVLRSVTIEEIPSAPQQIVIRGSRGQKGNVICAVIASDKFYLQTYYDLNTALDRFEVHCWLGKEGLSEFVDTNSGISKEIAENRVVVGDGIGSLYALAVVAFNNQKPVARSPFYLFKRTGIYVPDDISWRATDEGQIPRLKR